MREEEGERSSKLKKKDLHKTGTKNDVLQDKELNIANYEKHAIISYNGDKKNGRAHGDGIAKMNNGDEYIGKWVEGRMEGKGLLYQDRISSKYFGDFKNNLPDGIGRETHYSKGKWYEWYEGGFSEGKRHGNGVIRDKNGYKYNVKYDHGRLISKEIKQQDYRKHDDYSTDDNSDEEDKTTEVSNNVAKVNAKKKYRDIAVNLMGKNKSVRNYGKSISTRKKERESIVIFPDEEKFSNYDCKSRNNINDDNKNEKKSNFLHQTIKYSKGIFSHFRKPTNILQYHKRYNSIRKCDNKKELIFTHKKSRSLVN